MIALGLLDDIEKLDEGDGLKASLKRIEKLEEENQKLLKIIIKLIKSKEKSSSDKRRSKK